MSRIVNCELYWIFITIHRIKKNLLDYKKKAINSRWFQQIPTQHWNDPNKNEPKIRHQTSDIKISSKMNETTHLMCQRNNKLDNEIHVKCSKFGEYFKKCPIKISFKFHVKQLVIQTINKFIIMIKKQLDTWNQLTKYHEELYLIFNPTANNKKVLKTISTLKFYFHFHLGQGCQNSYNIFLSVG